MPGGKNSRKTTNLQLTWDCFYYFLRTANCSVSTTVIEMTTIYDQCFCALPAFKDVGPSCRFEELLTYLRRRRKIKVVDDLIIQRRPFSSRSITVDQYIKEREEKRVKLESKLQNQGGDGNTMYCKLCDTFGTKVTFENHLSGKRHRLQMCFNFIHKYSEILASNKYEIKITSDCDDEDSNMLRVVDKHQSVVVRVTVVNNSKTDSVKLIWCSLMMLRTPFSIDGDQIQLKIPPGHETVLTIRCETEFVNNYRNLLAFAFTLPDGQFFQILRSIVVEVTSELTKDLKATSPYQKPPRVFYRDIVRDYIDGVPLPSGPTGGLKMEPLDKYPIPNDLRETVKHDDEDEGVNALLDYDVTFKNYIKQFTTLLHVEEIQMAIDIQRYKMEGKTMTQRANERKLLRLKVPGLAENRPSVQRGDHLFAHIHNNPGKPFKGYVHRVEMEELVIGFHSSLVDKFIKNMKFDIRFTFGRLPLRLQHRAVHRAVLNELECVLFPTVPTDSARGLLCHVPTFVLFDRTLESNEQQSAAVRHITEGASRPAPYLVFGPPGTGKTVTIVEAIKQVYKNLINSKILACAPSNSAADLIAARLLKSTPVAKTTMFRMNARSRNWSNVDVELRQSGCCNYDGNDHVFPDIEVLKNYRIVITTLITAGRLAGACFPKDHFTHIFIDEAGHAQEPEAIVSVASLLNPKNPAGGQLVLAGDPKQLGPVLRSPHAVSYGLATSLLERLMLTNPLYARQETEPHYNPKLLTKLLNNYRSHPDILKLSNEIFYENELQFKADKLMRETMCQWQQLPNKNFPMIFHGVEGKDEREGNSPSFFNIQECDAVMTYVTQLMTGSRRKKMKQSDIGIISPYRRQVQKIQQAMRKHNYGEIKVGSVEEFQGQEKLIIIVSTVRSNNEHYLKLDVDFKLGFLDNPKRFNVAVTRAKALLIVVGNPVVLSKDKHWNKLLTFCVERGGYTGVQYDDVTMEDDMAKILNKFDECHITELAHKDEIDVSHVTQQNDPEWRSEV